MNHVLKKEADLHALWSFLIYLVAPHFQKFPLEAQLVESSLFILDGMLLGRTLVEASGCLSVIKLVNTLHIPFSGYDAGEKKRIPAWCDRVIYRDNRSAPVSDSSLECPVVTSILL